jgi:hypothetical protein
MHLVLGQYSLAIHFPSFRGYQKGRVYLPLFLHKRATRALGDEENGLILMKNSFGWL